MLYFASPFFRSVLEGGWRESHFSILDTDAESDSISDHEDLSDAEEAEAGYSSALDGDQSWNQKGAEGKVDHDPDQTRRASTRRSSLPLLSHSDAKASPTSPVGPDTPSGSSTSTPSRSTHVPRSSGLLPLAEANGATAVRERRRSASLGAVSVDGSTRASRPALDLAQPARDALTGMSSSGAGLGIAGETAPDSTSKEAHKDRWRTVVTEPSTPRARLAELATPPGSPRFGLSPHVSLSPLKWPENEAEPSLSTTTGTSSKRRERQRGRSTYDPRAAGTTQEKRARAARKKARDGIVAVIQLHEESASVFHDFLFHVYPRKFSALPCIQSLSPCLVFPDRRYFTFALSDLDLLVTWYNVEGLLRLADKFGAPLLKRASLSFLRAALAGKPIEALRLAEAHGLDESFKEASRHVLDNFAAWEMDELALLSGETLLKVREPSSFFLYAPNAPSSTFAFSHTSSYLFRDPFFIAPQLERRRTWFLERLLKLGLASPARDYVCHPNCPDPPTCARILDERWKHAYAGAFRFGPPQPSVIFRHLRELEINPPLALSACQSASKSWVQVRRVARLLAR